MVDLISFAPKGAVYVKSDGPAPDRDVIDAAGYQTLDLVLTALTLNGTMLVRLETALTLDKLAWQSLGVFTPLVAAGASDRRSFPGVLRYVRWRVETLTGGDAAFTLAGTAR